MDTYDPVQEIDIKQDNEPQDEQPDFSEPLDYDPAKNLEDLDGDRTGSDYADLGVQREEDN
jgi:hypothetical protein